MLGHVHIVWLVLYAGHVRPSCWDMCNHRVVGVVCWDMCNHREVGVVCWDMCNHREVGVVCWVMCNHRVVGVVCWDMCNVIWDMWLVLYAGTCATIVRLVLCAGTCATSCGWCCMLGHVRPS